MKVAIDISPLQTGHKVRGVGFYLKHLKEALDKYQKDIDFQYFSSIQEVREADVIHLPYYDPFSRTISSDLSIPTVVTVHDLTPVKFASHFPVGIRGKINWQRNKLALKKIAAIITDSESSKKDIIRYTSCPEEKIHVVYLAAGEEFVPKNLTSQRIRELRDKYSLPGKFALYVGDVTWNKNIPRLVRSCIDKEIPLVMVGKALAQEDYDRNHPWNKDLVITQKLIASNKNVSAIGFVSEEDLPDIYRLSTLLVMPSLYEGFGLPVVEAMQSGIPVVTSKEGSLLEVGGGAVKYVNAYSEENIGDGILEVFNSRELQQDLIIKGLTQAKKFSWDRTAKQTVQAYKKAFGISS